MLEVFTDLNERQQEAVRQVNGSLLVIAPVGTGKTKILTHRAANAINSGIKPSDILCLSFTNRAAREMKERVLSFLGKSAGDMTVCTFHGLCTHIIRNEADFLGIDSDFTIYDEEDAKTVLGRLWRKQGIAVSRTDMERFGAFLYGYPQSQDQKLAKLRWIINPLNL